MSEANSRRFFMRGAAVAVAAVALSGCVGETIQRGYIPDDESLAKLKPGVDAQAVLTTMGSPSTVSTVGNRTWYYVSQTTARRLAFMKNQVVDQRVVAVYFDNKMKVERIANYGIEDGKVFDFISRTTPTSGTEQSFLRNLMRGLGTFNPLGV